MSETKVVKSTPSPSPTTTATTTPPATGAQRVVAALEQRGLRDAADIARDAAGMPARMPTADEDFISTLHACVDKGGTVGFNDDDEATSARREQLARSEAAPDGRSYRVTRQHSKRFEVALV